MKKKSWIGNCTSLKISVPYNNIVKVTSVSFCFHFPTPYFYTIMFIEKYNKSFIIRQKYLMTNLKLLI